MSAPISTVTQRERDLWAAAGRIVDRDDCDDEAVHISDEALDDFLSGEPISE